MPILSSDPELFLLSPTYLSMLVKMLEECQYRANQRSPYQSQSEGSLSVVDLRLKVQLYKVRFLVLSRNLQAAKREVKMAMSLARGKDYHHALYLKSQLEYARGNPHKAIKILMASDNRMEDMYYNNLGCIYYHLGKHHTSGVFFSKALKSSMLGCKEALSQDKSLFISYNCGVYSLACGRPFSAARCFQKSTLIFYNRPLLWLRIAECCLMALEKGLITSDSERTDIMVSVIGKGKWRQLALSSESSSNKEHVRKDGQPELSLTLARQCLVNALYLLESTEGNELSEMMFTNQKNANEPNINKHSALLQNSITHYEEICTKENHMMKQAVLADLAYVELALGNPLVALTTAKSLLELPECSKIYTFLGTMYVSESLCLLNRPNEAAEHLMKYVSCGSVELPYTKEDREKWKAEKLVDNDDSKGGTLFSSPEEARGILSANFAAFLALTGDFERSQYFVMKALSDIPNSTQAILTAIYLDIKQGKTQEALAKLKQHNGTRFLPGSFNLNNAS